MFSESSWLTERLSSLEPQRNVLTKGDSYVALTDEPWLSFPSAELFNRFRFVELVYATTELRAPVRPLLRFWCGGESFVDHIAPAPINGVGKWVGHIPSGVTAVWCCPTNRPGPFDFTISAPRPVSRRALFKRFARSPKRVFFALAAGWVGLKDEAALNWRWALGKSPWEEAKRSPFRREAAKMHAECAEKSRPPGDFVIVIDAADASADEIDESCESIERQSWLSWRVDFLGNPAAASARERLSYWKERPGFHFNAALEDGLKTDFGVRLAAGDILADEALSHLAAHFSQHSEHQLVYADEIRHDAGGVTTVLKPGWSPALQRSTRYIGRAAAFRTDILRNLPNWRSLPAEDAVDQIASRLSLGEAGALRLALFECVHSKRPSDWRQVEAVYRGQPPSVSIVLPTRDKADLLRPCLQSLFDLTEYGNFDIALIDNDSVEPHTLSLMQEMQAAHERLKVIRIPGKFNFSALANAGASACAGEYLLFLNNDTEIVTPDWIERLLFFATQADIGAVGAKLLYPNRKVQHAGVLLGMGGVAGHFGAGLDESDPGWMGRNLASHEVSAVTGACLMVARSKFEAVGRFDEINLPVDLNDVDLCLRLAAQGWRTICNSEAVLFHRQSASRGGGLRLQQVYERERRYFSERWRAIIRDDPYFHPGLSLYSTTEAPP